jgi:hypothetical protein
MLTWTLSPGVGAQGTGGAVGEAVGGAVGAAADVAIPGLSGLSEGIEKARAWLTTPANLGRLGMAVVAGAIILIGVATLVVPVVKDTIRDVRPV